MIGDDLVGAMDARFGALVAALKPAARSQLAKQLAKQLRQQQMARIAAQINPDGSAFEPRKPQLRNRKKDLRGGMFGKLRTARYLTAAGTADAAVVRFTRDVARIARVHQLGLRDRVSRKSTLEAQYPQRQLLGINAFDESTISHLISAHLARVL